MAPEKPEADGFLALIERKIAALKALADSYRAAVSVGALGQPGEVEAGAFDAQVGPSGSGGAFDLPTGALLGKSIPAAVKLYLSAVKKKQSIREIATALKEEGVESTAASFENTVGSALVRLKANGEVLRFKDGWALAEFYPAHLRTRIEEKATPRRKIARRKPSNAAPPKPKAESKQRAAKPKKFGPSIDDRVAAYLAAHSGQRFSPKQVGDALNETDPKIVAMAFARLKGRGRVVRAEDGLYSAPPQASHPKAV